MKFFKFMNQVFRSIMLNWLLRKYPDALIVGLEQKLKKDPEETLKYLDQFFKIQRKYSFESKKGNRRFRKEIVVDRRGNIVDHYSNSRFIKDVSGLRESIKWILYKEKKVDWTDDDSEYSFLVSNLSFSE